MGNASFSCLRPSAAGDGGAAVVLTGSPPPLDEALGHSFCYLRSEEKQETAFSSISGAAVSANSSNSVPSLLASTAAAAGGFQSSDSFSAIPLQLSANSGPLDPHVSGSYFLSGPIERGAVSGPLDHQFSGPLHRKKRRSRGSSFSFSKSLLRRSFSERNRRPLVVPLRGPHSASTASSAEGMPKRAQWARGCAGEDRVHVVVSEDHRWLFVGIYDGFNGPDAPEFLLAHLYATVHTELRGLFWDESEEFESADLSELQVDEPKIVRRLYEFLADKEEDNGDLNFSTSGRFTLSMSKLKQGLGSWRKWRVEGDEKTKVEGNGNGEFRKRRRKKLGHVQDHDLVLSALARALEKTENAYLEMTDKAMDRNPELALMGSCLLVVLMRDDDVYVMNVGDSRAIIAQYGYRRMLVSCSDLVDGVDPEGNELGALQLSTDHSTSVEEEVLRIREEHPDDDQCIVNERVKGRLKVTRAFGAGFLKQPKWNNSLLEMFRNDYIGTAPYVTCTPSLCHHKLSQNDHFLVLSSDGLYQYLTNEEVVLHVESFMERFPEGDPAQSLIEKLLCRAAKKAGMDFYELLDIPQGDRRKYHDDVTVMVISLEGRIWKSSGEYLH